ncbi:MAG: exosortase-associated EpsI family protein [bacterium]
MIRNHIFHGMLLIGALLISRNLSEAVMYTFTSDTGYYFASSHEGKMNTAADFMEKEHIENIPYSLGSWQGYDLDHTDENIVFFRAYNYKEDEDAKIYFIAVHGTVESRFHTAEVCYINDSWVINKRGFIEIPSGDKKFEAKYFTAQKGGWQHLLVYWFLWKDSRRIMNDGCVMFRIGVRMTDISEEKARSYAFDFINNLSLYSPGGNILTPTVIPPEIKDSALILHNPGSPYYEVRTKSIEWITNQVVPNKIVPSPSPGRRNLILSYELSKNADAYKYIYSKSSLYDNGVAIIALCIERQFEQASKIIDAIMRMGGTEGDLFFTFNTHNTWPNKDDKWGAIIRSGASAWAGQAIVFYVKARVLDDPEILKNNSEMNSYITYAKTIADTMLKRMVLDTSDARYGLITGGNGTYVLELNKEVNKVEETFKPGEVSWCSIEHNIDMYFFLQDLGEVSGELKYTQAAELLGTRIITQCWNEPEGQFNRGQSAAIKDTVMALDCASWGSLLLSSRKDMKKAHTAALSSENYSCPMPEGRGYKPYRKKLIFERYNVGKYYYPGKPKKSWDDVNMMWTEGALGAALAYLRMGDQVKGKQIINDVIRYQVSSGGIRYSTLYVPHEFAESPAAAPTGWLIIAIGVLEDNPIAQLFWK